jgi:hypothetical protein
MRAAACASWRKRGAEGGIVGERGLQQLDRDAAAEAGVDAGVHVGHAAATEELADLVATGEQTDVCRHPFCHDRPLGWPCCALRLRIA